MTACLVAYGCAGLAPVDVRPRLTATARALAPAAPAPVWQQTLSDPQVDALVPLGRGRLLVKAGHLALYDIASGQPIWTSDAAIGVAQLVSTAPLLALTEGEGPGTLWAFDDSTGRLRWQRPVAREHALAFDPEAGMVLLAERRDRGVRMTALDARGDTALWVRDHAWRQVPRLVGLRAHRVLVIGDSSAVVAMGDGSVRFPLREATTTTFVELSDGLFGFTSAGEVQALDEGTGAVRWRVSAPPDGAWRVVSFTRDADRMVAAWSSDSQRTRIASFRLSDGQVLWERRAAGEITSQLRLADSLLVFSTTARDSGTIRFWSRNGGQPLLEAGLPATMRRLPPDSVLQAYGRTDKLPQNRLPCSELPEADVNLLPDLMVPYPEHIVVLQETAVGAISRRTGEVLWWHRVAGAEGTMACVQLNRIAANKYTRATARAGREMPLVDRLLAGFSASQRLEQQREGLMTARARDARDRSLTPEQMRANQQVAGAQAWGGVLMAEANVLSAMEASAQRTLFGQRAAQIDRMTVLAPQFQDALQGDLYVRAFHRAARTGAVEHSWEMCSLTHQCEGYQGRSGILVVDVRTGGWREITTGPFESRIEQIALDFAMPIVTPDGGRLIVAAAGLDTARWLAAPRTIHLIHAAPQSVLAYDLAGGGVHPAAEYANRETQLRGRPLDLPARLAQIRGNITTEDELRTWFGPPTERVGGALVWESLREGHGAVRYERLSCSMRGRVVADCVSGPPAR